MHVQGSRRVARIPVEVEAQVQWAEAFDEARTAKRPYRRLPVLRRVRHPVH